MFQIIKSSITIFLGILLFQGLLFPMEEEITKAYPLFSPNINQNKHTGITIAPSIPMNLTIEIGNNGTTSLRCPYPGCNQFVTTTLDRNSKPCKRKRQDQGPRGLREKFMNQHLLEHEQEKILHELNKIPDQLENDFQNDLELIIRGSHTIKKCIFKNCTYNPSHNNVMRRHIMSHIHIEKSVSNIPSPIAKKRPLETADYQINFSNLNATAEKMEFFNLFTFRNTYKNSAHHIIVCPFVAYADHFIVVNGKSGSTICPYCGNFLEWKSEINDSVEIARKVRKKFMEEHFSKEEEKIWEELRKIPNDLVPEFETELKKIISKKSSPQKCIFKNCKIIFSGSAINHFLSHIYIEKSVNDIFSFTAKNPRLETSTNNNQPNLSDVNNFEEQFLNTLPDNLENQEEINKVVSELESL